MAYTVWQGAFLLEEDDEGLKVAAVHCFTSLAHGLVPKNSLNLRGRHRLASIPMTHWVAPNWKSAMRPIKEITDTVRSQTRFFPARRDKSMLIKEAEGRERRKAKITCQACCFSVFQVRGKLTLVAMLPDSPIVKNESRRNMTWQGHSTLMLKRETTASTWAQHLIPSPPPSVSSSSTHGVGREPPGLHQCPEEPGFQLLRQTRRSCIAQETVCVASRCLNIHKQQPKSVRSSR